MSLPDVLGCEKETPTDIAASRNLFIEAGYALDAKKEAPERGARYLTGHAPFGFPDGWPREGRLNIAALDPAWLRDSMDCLEDYLARAARFPGLRLVNMHAAPRLWKESKVPGKPQAVGEYALLIENLRRLADLARKLNLTLTVENNRAYWDAVPDEMPFLQADRTEVREYFGTTSQEWIQIWRDVARENLWLCLDTSHATTCVHRYDDREERRRALYAYLAEPRALRHIHWNDNDPWDVAGRDDRHLPIGKSGLGDEFNRAIRKLQGVSFLIEHFTDAATLDGELQYISRL